ncbi:hypothetical protein BZA05DRAFT_386527 [Tricharina praecox]|uniref:uncharacterized protein n=1 Tax=Tricharina praecox TaxID=43433 RepID=UPI002220CC1D|nr:uncharacterized protein BZA05DRAFT_386527 [Tricharina praecox]KAI5856899.1 hypothetical protein BZA05DRAFT_386527 [Tricharina praecox]
MYNTVYTHEVVHVFGAVSLVTAAALGYNEPTTSHEWTTDEPPTSRRERTIERDLGTFPASQAAFCSFSFLFFAKLGISVLWERGEPSNKCDAAVGARSRPRLCAHGPKTMRVKYIYGPTVHTMRYLRRLAGFTCAESAPPCLVPGP